MKITRSKPLQIFRDTCAVQEQQVPNELNNSVQPVLDINPKYTEWVNFNNSTSTGTLTLLTAPLDKDLYITWANVCITKDAACTLTTSSLQAKQNGVASTLITMRMQTTTAGTFIWGQSYPHPIKVDRGGTIVLTGTFGAGTCDKAAQFGYFVME